MNTDQLIDQAQALHGNLHTHMPDGAAKADAIKACEQVLANLRLVHQDDVVDAARELHKRATGEDFDALSSVERRAWVDAARAGVMAASERTKEIERAEAKVAEAQAEVDRLLVAEK